VEATTQLSDYPHADEVRDNVLVYGSWLREHVATPEARRDVQAELARALTDGPGRDTRSPPRSTWSTRHTVAC
jgi:hypothetical protein